MLDEGSKGRVRELCDRIAKEPNPERFAKLVQELNEIFDSANLSQGQDRVAEKSQEAKKTS